MLHGPSLWTHYLTNLCVSVLWERIRLLISHKSITYHTDPDSHCQRLIPLLVCLFVKWYSSMTKYTDSLQYVVKQTKTTLSICCGCCFNTRMDKDSSMTVDWGEFLHHVILNPVDNIGELVSSWKHSLVRSRGHITSDDATLQRSRGVHLGMSDDTIVRL